jgi:hypothetical protein
MGIEPEPPQPIANLDPAFREQAVKNCMDVLSECAGARSLLPTLVNRSESPVGTSLLGF